MVRCRNDNCSVFLLPACQHEIAPLLASTTGIWPVGKCYREEAADTPQWLSTSGNLYTHLGCECGWLLDRWPSWRSCIRQQSNSNIIRRCQNNWRYESKAPSFSLLKFEDSSHLRKNQPLIAILRELRLLSLRFNQSKWHGEAATGTSANVDCPARLICLVRPFPENGNPSQMSGDSDCMNYILVYCKKSKFTRIYSLGLLLIVTWC